MKKLYIVRTIILAASLLLQFSTLCFQSRGATNDNFASAQVISGSTGTTMTDNTDATKQPAEPDHANNDGGSSLWFDWTAPSNGQFGFNTSGSAIDTLLAVYTGANVSNLTPVASNDDSNLDYTSAVSVRATAGITYRVAIDGFDGETGALVLNWAPEIPPANDNFTNAQVIHGSAGSSSGANSGATKEIGEPDHAGEPGGRSVWFQWTAPATGQFSFNTAGSDFDTLLAVYTGAAVNALTLVASNDESGTDFTSQVSFPATNGTTYHLAVDGYYGALGSLVLNWAASTNEVVDAVELTLKTLHSFTNSSGDGSGPNAGLVLSGNTLYGTTVYGGTSGNGTLFKVNIDGTGYALLHSFNYSGGANPYAAMIAAGNTLYGTTRLGGSSGYGTVFAISTNGTGFTNLHKFSAASGSFPTNSDGALPHAELILSGNTLYGTTTSGGTSGKGTVFAVRTDGTGFTNLHSFTATSGTASTNSDGANPYAGLRLSGDTLYGAAVNGGSSGFGTVFAVSTNGTGFTTLHNFNWSNGAYPRGLVLSGNTLFGSGNGGGSSGNGSVFAVNTGGSGFTNLYSFSGDLGPLYTNRYGSSPFGGLFLSGNTLYGTTLGGGSSGKGTVFAVNTNGTGVTSLYSFSAPSGLSSTNSDGASPRCGLILSGNALYGTADKGGSSGYGTVFSLSFPLPQLTILPSGANVILTWPTVAAGFTLQFTTNLTLLSSWSTVPQPAVTNASQISVTIPTTDVRKFFRLKSQ